MNHLCCFLVQQSTSEAGVAETSEVCPPFPGCIICTWDFRCSYLVRKPWVSSLTLPAIFHASKTHAYLLESGYPARKYTGVLRTTATDIFHQLQWPVILFVVFTLFVCNLLFFVVFYVYLLPISASCNCGSNIILGSHSIYERVKYI